jgi:hypothetical protein
MKRAFLTLSLMAAFIAIIVAPYKLLRAWGK